MKEKILARLRYTRGGVFAFNTNNVFENLPYKRTHRTERIAQLRSWKKTQTALRSSVSKLYVTVLCGDTAQL
jgi:hypothetical protein